MGGVRARAGRIAVQRARRFREEAPELGGFEGLIWAVEELMAPLDAFATAAERFQRLGARDDLGCRAATRAIAFHADPPPTVSDAGGTPCPRSR